MPVFQLPDEIIFPDPSLAEENGLLAIGGDLSPARLLTAYANGIFPWYSSDEPILWWSPSPRCVLFPHKFKIPKSLRSVLRKKIFEIRFDTEFENVIRFCAQVMRKGQQGDTWITPEMQTAYIKLHYLGYAHSVEAFYLGELVGGLYGVSIGKAFFGESMFHLVPNASKVAFCYLVNQLQKWNYEIIDNQQTSEHLLRFGAEEIDRSYFQQILKRAVRFEGFTGNWANLITDLDLNI